MGGALDPSHGQDGSARAVSSFRHVGMQGVLRHGNRRCGVREGRADTLLKIEMVGGGSDRVDRQDQGGRAGMAAQVRGRQGHVIGPGDRRDALNGPARAIVCESQARRKARGAGTRRPGSSRYGLQEIGVGLGDRGGINQRALDAGAGTINIERYRSRALRSKNVFGSRCYRIGAGTNRRSRRARNLSSISVDCQPIGG